MYPQAIRALLYQLQGTFGITAVLYKKSGAGTLNVVTGVQSLSFTSATVRLILLPINYKVEERLGRYKGDVKTGDREILIDAKYGMTERDYFVANGLRFEVIEMVNYLGTVYFALVRNVQDES